MAGVRLSVVIPTLNESAALPGTLERVRAASARSLCEVVVSDCGSTDATTELARAGGARVVSGGTSRATAMNLGARVAVGEALLFLHADCKVPGRFDERVVRFLASGGCGGGFDFNWATHPLCHGVNRQLLRAVRVANRIRFRWTGNFYGDQGLFVRADVFRALGGFPELPLMEDLEFSRRLRRFARNHGARVGVLTPAIKTSPRRFLTRGVVRQFVDDLMLLSKDALGLDVRRPVERYNGLNRSGRYVQAKKKSSRPVLNPQPGGHAAVHS